VTRERKRDGKAAKPATDDGVPGGQFALVFVFRLSAFGWKSSSHPDYASATRSGCATALNSRYGSGVSPLMTTWFLSFLWLNRREVSGRRQNIVWAEIGNDGSHERSPNPVSVATLHVIELPRKVARRAPRKRWYRAKAAEIPGVANRARGDFATIGSDPVYDQSFSLLEAAGWHIGDGSVFSLSRLPVR
jgi:hypothetical protein